MVDEVAQLRGEVVQLRGEVVQLRGEVGHMHTLGQQLATDMSQLRITSLEDQRLGQDVRHIRDEIAQLRKEFSDTDVTDEVAQLREQWTGLCATLRRRAGEAPPASASP